PSRWLLRLDAVLAAAGLDPLRGGDGPAWLRWQAALDRPDRPVPVEPPAPRPPLAVRPRRLSVTQVETWMRDPYAIYARHVLDLKPLEPLEADPGAAERGIFIHQALDRFVRQFPDALPDDAVARLLEIGAEVFGAALGHPAVRAFWWPRFERVAHWFLERERARREAVAQSATECEGRLVIDGPQGPFTVTAKADRIDRLSAGGYAIIDYKSGVTPKKQEIELGFAPQLPLEAAIARAGGFHGLPAGDVAALAFWRLSGGDPPGEERPLQQDVAELAEAALAGLKALITAFDDPATPYRATPDSARAPSFNDYAHLARTREWSAHGGEGGE
ncbi:MAG: PD-(D/E)XK nuclease family protein, partial [Kiloniellales bacterium]